MIQAFAKTGFTQMPATKYTSSNPFEFPIFFYFFITGGSYLGNTLVMKNNDDETNSV